MQCTASLVLLRQEIERERVQHGIYHNLAKAYNTTLQSGSQPKKPLPRIRERGLFYKSIKFGLAKCYNYIVNFFALFVRDDASVYILSVNYQ